MDNERIDEILSSAMENPDQAILDLMPLVSSTLNSWLKTRPSLIYLKDDMLSEGFLALTEVINKVVSGSNSEVNAGYLAMTFKYSFVDVVRSDQVILFPKGKESEHPKRTVKIGKVFSPTDDYATISDYLDSTGLTPEERLLADNLVEGHTLEWIQEYHEISGFRRVLNSLKEKVKHLNWNLLEQKESNEVTNT